MSSTIEQSARRILVERHLAEIQAALAGDTSLANSATLAVIARLTDTVQQVITEHRPDRHGICRTCHPRAPHWWPSTRACPVISAVALRLLADVSTAPGRRTAPRASHHPRAHRRVAAPRPALATTAPMLCSTVTQGAK
jgi:hypothetical protein